MTFASAIAALSLYPWNLGLNYAGTIGTSSTAHHYTAHGAYVVLDRRDQDLFVFGYEKLNIRFTGVDYSQNLAMVRTSTWLGRAFRPGVLLGNLSSNGIDGGNCLGVRLDGDVWKIGYTASHQAGEWRVFDWKTYVQSRLSLHQSDFQLRYNFAAVTFSANYILSSTTEKQSKYGMIGCNWHPVPMFDLALQVGQGRSRIQTDWYALTLDNNPDDLTRNFKVRALFLPLPQIGISTTWVKKYYAPVSANVPWKRYSASFWVAGLQLRV